jgi:hypothetical protein
MPLETSNANLNFLSAETEDAHGNSNLSLTDFTWDDDVFGPEWLNSSDFTVDLGEEHNLGSGVESTSISAGLQTAFDTMILPERSFHQSSSVPMSLDHRDPSSLLERRKFSEPELELNSDLALHILRSYPYMIANQGSVPPFIHPEYQRLSEGDTERLSPLSAALKLSTMLLHGQRTNKSLTWGLIRMEQERLLNEVRKMRASNSGI